MSEYRSLSHLVERFLSKLANLLFVAVSVIAEHLSCVDVGRRVNVRLIEHAHDREDDLFDAASGVPSFISGFLLIILVCPWGVQDRDANLTIGEN
jgi:hypothetical protein